MQEDGREARHALRNSLVTMSEACVTAYLETMTSAGKPGDSDCNLMAVILSQMITLYTVSEDLETVRIVTPEELKGGRFIDRGRVLAFKDGRAPIERLATTRTSLTAALEVMKRLKNRQPGPGPSS